MLSKDICKNKTRLFFLLISFFVMTTLGAEKFLIDNIETVIYGPEETSIITRSDLARVGLDGQKRDLDKLIFEQLVYQDAKKYNILDEKLVDRYIEAIQAQHNLTLDDLKKMFADFGYTFEEGKEQLAMFNTIDQLLTFKVRSKVIIPEKEVRAYYDANPVYQQEAYYLQRVFVPVDVETDAGGQVSNAELEALKKDISQKTKIGHNISGADYSDPFWIENPDLAEDKMFISKLKIGASSEPQYYEDGFEVFTLIDRKEKKLIPFEQRHKEIIDAMRAPLFEKLFDDYKQSLYKESVIVQMP